MNISHGSLFLRIETRIASQELELRSYGQLWHIPRYPKHCSPLVETIQRGFTPILVRGF